MSRNSALLFIVSLGIFSFLLLSGLRTFTLAIQKPASLGLALQSADTDTLANAGSALQQDFKSHCADILGTFSDPSAHVPHGFDATAQYFYNASTKRCFVSIVASRMTGTQYEERADLYTLNDGGTVAWFRLSRPDEYTAPRIDSCVVLAQFQRLCSSRAQYEQLVQTLITP